MRMRLPILLTAGLALLLTSCNKEDEPIVVTGDDTSLHIMPLSCFAESANRVTFPGREVCLVAVAPGCSNTVFTWTVDSKPDDEHGRILTFTPDVPGTYRVSVEAVIDGVVFRRECSVTAVDATEPERFRAPESASSALAADVFEYLPAPGQFVGEAKGITTPADAAVWAQGRLTSGKMVSLGAFGGYVIAGFDHSVAASGGDYDFAIHGNAFVSENGSSNEPGIVWVMQDVNGNGLPDDEWYELRGSEYDSENTVHNTYVTYSRPGSVGQDVAWTDAEGASGTVTYLTSLKKTGRDYYPAWIATDTYTLYGSRIAPRNIVNPANGMWNNTAYPWGYADNIGSDNLSGHALGPGSYCGFRISNAVNADGSPVQLAYIDFVKIQCATQAESGPLGEVSTEIYSIIDLNISQ